MHYIELDDNGAFHGVYPLNEEIAGTAFYDGVLVPVLSSEPAIGFKQVMGSWPALTEKITPGCSVHIYRLSGIPLASAKLGTDHSCSDGHIETPKFTPPTPEPWWNVPAIGAGATT